MNSIYKSIYCMENYFCSTLDRPSFLPEPNHPLNFDIRQPTEYSYSLYRIQSRYRSASDPSCLHILQSLDTTALEQLTDMESSISPNILSTVYETKLLLHPDPATAAQLLRSYTNPRYIYTFLAAQWAYRSGMIVFNAYYSRSWPRAAYMEAYGTCLLILERASQKWPGAASLIGSIEALVRSKEES